MADKDKSSPIVANARRRGFLLSLGTGTVAAAAAAIKPITEATPQLPEPAASAGRGYRETTHVRDYYRTTKI